jgi:hypothetical protein
MTLPLVIGIGVTNGLSKPVCREQTPSILPRALKGGARFGLTTIAGFGI